MSNIDERRILEAKREMNDCLFESATRQHDMTDKELLEEIVAIENQIADAEVTYSIGDRFKNTCGGAVEYEMLLCKIYDSGEPRVTLVGFDEYVSYGAKSFRVDDFKNITQTEMDRILFGNGDFITRIWDNRKQQKGSE